MRKNFEDELNKMKKELETLEKQTAQQKEENNTLQAQKKESEIIMVANSLQSKE